MFNILIKSHSYTINLANVSSIRKLEFNNGKIGTRFVLFNDYAVQITCPYDEVMKQIAQYESDPSPYILDHGEIRIIELEY